MCRLPLFSPKQTHLAGPGFLHDARDTPPTRSQNNVEISDASSSYWIQSDSHPVSDMIIMQQPSRHLLPGPQTHTATKLPNVTYHLLFLLFLFLLLLLLLSLAVNSQRPELCRPELTRASQCDPYSRRIGRQCSGLLAVRSLSRSHTHIPSLSTSLTPLGSPRRR